MPEMTLGEALRAMSNNRDLYFKQSRMTLAGKRSYFPAEAAPLESLYTPKLAPLHKRVWWWMRSLL